MAEVYFLLACYGLTFTLCDASIFERPRAFIRSKSQFVDDLLGCYFCTGFWVSLMWHLFLFYEFGGNRPTDWTYTAWILVHAFAGASFCYAFNTLIVLAEMIREKEQLNSVRIIQEIVDDDAA